MKVLLVEPQRGRDWGPHQQYLGLLRIGNWHQCIGDDVEYVFSPNPLAVDVMGKGLKILSKRQKEKLEG